MRTIQIFTNQTSDGSSSEFSTNGKIFLHIIGTFDGATIDLHGKTNNANDAFSSTGDTALSAVGAWELNYAPGVTYKLVLAGVGASTSINAFVTN